MSARIATHAANAPPESRCRLAANRLWLRNRSPLAVFNKGERILTVQDNCCQSAGICRHGFRGIHKDPRKTGGQVDRT
jgi:hypothetical protein